MLICLADEEIDRLSSLLDIFSTNSSHLYFLATLAYLGFQARNPDKALKKGLSLRKDENEIESL